MEIVVFRSDIARLVLGYLKSHNLVRASQTFCKTSPHLKEELNAYKQGLQSYSFFPDLEEIICEYVLIKQKADSSLRRLPDKVRVLFQYKKLSDVISELILIAIQAILHDNSFILSDGVHNTSNSNKPSQSPYVEKSKAKRKRSLSRGRNGYESNSSAKRLKPNPFCYLMQRKAKCMENIERANRSESGTNSDSESDESSSSTEASESHSEVFSELNKTRESTPLSDRNVADYKTPSVPEMRQAILENKEFTERLAQHINEGLKLNKPLSQNSTVDIEVDKLPEAELNLSVADQNFDSVVKNIVTATEKDPELDAIIQELIDGVNRKSNTPFKKPEEEINPVKNDVLLSSNDPNLSVSSANTENQANNSQLQPKTPLIIRNAMTTGNPNETDAQNMPLLPINTSFGSMIDPNFSLSKLIFLNATSSCQKNNVDPVANANQSLNEAILNQLDANILENVPTEQQIHVDPTSGQISFPVFLTNEGLIANFPIIINNDLLNQDIQAQINSIPPDVILQPVSMPVEQLPSPSKATGSTPKVANREPKSGAPKTLELCQQTVNKIKETNYQMISASVDSKLLPLERGTPSTIGIVNVKALRSLSTPRKRESHVRTLTFSPKSLLPKTLINASLAEANKRFVKEDQSHEVEPPAENIFADKPIIKKVEVINPVLATSIPDINSNESNSSCPVPPLFRNADEYGNQTVVHCDLNAVAKPMEGPTSTSTETPKRKQPRRMAGRACKLKLVPSPAKAKKPISNASEKGKKKTKSEKTENPEDLDKVESKKENAECQISEPVAKEEADKTMAKTEIGLEEWTKLRSLTNNDLDSHLREINASQEKKTSNQRVPRKRIRRKKPIVEKMENETEAAGPEAKQDPYQQPQSVTNEKITKTLARNNTQPVQPEVAEDKTCKSQQKGHVNIRILQNEKNNNKEMSAHFSARMPENEHMLASRHTVELEKRTANIAHLLETPFKQTKMDCGKSVPPTPGILPLSLSTPLPKARLPDEILHSESYLFGSIGKSDLDTPLHSAVTPGFRIHPFGSKDATPLSIVPSEYSSCSSYYKPDENAEIDKNLEKIMRETENNLSAKNSQRRDKTNECATEVGPVVDPLVIKRMPSTLHNQMELTDDPKENAQLQYSLVSAASEMGELAYNTSASSSSSIVNNDLVAGNKTYLDSAAKSKDVSKFVPAECEISQLPSTSTNDAQKHPQRNFSTLKKPHLSLNSIAEINEDAAVYNLNLLDENKQTQATVITTEDFSKPNEDKNKYFSMFSSSSKPSEFNQFATHQISSQSVEPAKLNHQTKEEKQSDLESFQTDHRSIELLNALQLSAKKSSSVFVSADIAATTLKTTTATPAKNAQSSSVSGKSKAKTTDAESQNIETKTKKTCKSPNKTKAKASSGKASASSATTATGKSTAKTKKSTAEKKQSEKQKSEVSSGASKPSKAKTQAAPELLQPLVSESQVNTMQQTVNELDKVDGVINTNKPVAAMVENEADDFDERVITTSEKVAESSYFHFIYDDAKGVVPPTVPVQRNIQLETYSMCVEIDNDVSCTLRVGDEQCLCCFTANDDQQQPKNIKNIPKKRHIRTGNNEEGGKISTKTKLSEKNLQDCTIAEHICEHNSKATSRKTSRDSNSLYKPPAPTVDTGESLVALKNFEDIENILSQLHGT